MLQIESELEAVACTVYDFRTLDNAQGRFLQVGRVMRNACFRTQTQSSSAVLFAVAAAGVVAAAAEAVRQPYKSM